MEGITFYFEWEKALMEWLHSFLGGPGITAASFATFLGEEVMLIAVLGFLYWCWDKKAGQFIGLNVMVGLILNPMVKNAVMRRRPYFDHKKIRCLKPVHPDADIYDITAQGYSFPSGHSMNAAIVYGSLPAALTGRPVFWSVLAFLLPLLAGISRVLLGVHYPTDVLAGWILGGLVVLVMSALQRRVRRQGCLRLAVFLLAIPGIFYCRTTDYFTSLGLMAGFVLAVPFEERFVQFENTRKATHILLRMAGGFLLYFGLNKLLKLPFSAAFLGSPELPSLLVRSLRYMIITFVLLGVYPLAFGRIKRGQREPSLLTHGQPAP